MRLKKIIGKVHLWLGLASGLIVFVVSITGCILAFEQEINSVAQPYRYIEKTGSRTLISPGQLIAIAEKELGKKASGITYHSSDKSASVSFLTRKPLKYELVYINPYTGVPLKVWDMDNDFFRFILNGHFNLWLPRSIGQPIVSYATLVFVIMLITGMVLWWPKNLKKGNLDKSFKIKWNAKWRRLNYDLHNVPGFYAFSIVLIIALTGMMFGIKWFSDSVYWISSGGKTKERMEAGVSDTSYMATSSELVIDKVWKQLITEKNNEGNLAINLPLRNTQLLTVSSNHTPSTYYTSTSRYFDQFSGKEVKGKDLFNGKKEEAELARLLHSLSYDIHVGGILGLPGKVLAFFASLISASLPVSGFVIWWGRRNKERKTNKSYSPADKLTYSQNLFKTVKPKTKEKEKITECV